MKILLLTTLFLISLKSFSQEAQTKKAIITPISEASRHTGKVITVMDSVYGTRLLAGGSPLTFLNLGGTYPDQKLTVVIRGQDRDKFSEKPEEHYKNKWIAVTGKVTEYKGKPQIEVTGPAQIAIAPLAH